MELKTSLKDARKQANLSQEEVATRLHISRQAISQWETGKSYPDIDNLKLLGDIYGLNFDNILKGRAESTAKIDTSVPKEQTTTDSSKQDSSKDEGLILMLLSCVLFAIAPIGVVIAPFIIWRNKKTNRFWQLVLVLAICAFLYSLYISYIGISDVLGWGATGYK